MSTVLQARTRDYERHAAASDRGAWSVERDIDWHAIDATLALRTPDVLDALRGAVLIESFHPVNLARLMRATWDDVDAGVAFGLERWLLAFLCAHGPDAAAWPDILREV